MPRQYRVVDCRPGAHDEEGTMITAPSPESAALKVLKEVLFRSGKAKYLRARVYSQEEEGGPLSVVRLYSRAADR